MANIFFGFDNFVTERFHNVVLSRGNWQSDQGLSKLKSKDLFDVAVSNGDGLASTRFDVDLGAPRPIRVFAIPDNVSSFNPSIQARHRILGSNTAKWRGLAVTGSHSAGAGVIDVKETQGSPVTIDAGDVFSVLATLPTGQPVWATYTVSSTVVVSAGSSASVTITGTLNYDYEEDDKVDCNIGDFSSPLKEIGWEDVFPILFPFGSLPWWNPSALTGKISAENRVGLPFPVVKVFDTIVARYWRYELDDEGHRPWDAANIQIPYLFIGNGYQPTYNPSYTGAQVDFISGSKVDTTLGGRRIIGVEPTARKLTLTFKSLEEQEAFTQAFDAVWRNSLDKEMMFIFDPDDTTLMHRRAFLAQLQRKKPITFPFHGHNDVQAEVIEVL